MVTGARVADEGAIHCCGRREDFARGKIGPVARADQAAGFNPVQAVIEVRGKRGARFGLHGKRFGTQHTLAQTIAEAVDHFIVSAHTLLHDFRSDADHVRVANLAALDNSYDSHARAQLAGLWGHAHHADVGGFERFEHWRWRRFHRAWA